MNKEKEIKDEELQEELEPQEQEEQTEEGSTLEAELEEAQQQINMLSQKDSLERFAREQYYMHEKGEDIYLVEENDK